METELLSSGDPMHAHFSEPLHVQIMTTAPPALAYGRISGVLARLLTIFHPPNVHKNRQSAGNVQSGGEREQPNEEQKNSLNAPECLDAPSVETLSEIQVVEQPITQAAEETNEEKPLETQVKLESEEVELSGRKRQFEHEETDEAVSSKKLALEVDHESPEDSN